MPNRTITLTDEQLGSLADKLDEFGESLDADERGALLALLTLAAERLADAGEEVSGFQLSPDRFSVAIPPALSFSLLGDALRMNVDIRPSGFTFRTGSQ